MTLYRFFLATAIFIAAVPAFAQVVSTGEMVVLDSTSQTVGRVIDQDTTLAGERLKTVLFIDGEPALLRMQGGSLPFSTYLYPGIDQVSVQFNSFDCSGQPYLTTPLPIADYQSVPVFPTNGPTLSLWVIANPTLTNIIPNSMLSSDGTCFAAGGALNGYPAEEIRTQFSAPFQVGFAPLTSTIPASVPAASPIGSGVLALILLIAAGRWLMRRRQ